MMLLAEVLTLIDSGDTTADDSDASSETEL